MKLISIEDQIIKATISVLLKAGYLLSVNDGEETTVKYSRIPDEIFAAMKTTGEDYLLVFTRNALRKKGWVRFIYGNDDAEVFNDYTVNLDPIMIPIFAMIDEYEAR